ncbi:hypothetical protein NMY22_g11940 [Coprinellus aureogranulatus]|nr:hypothetical protein NMY22_g11940 [Coprinellus aureogranulatus]
MHSSRSSSSSEGGSQTLHGHCSMTPPPPASPCDIERQPRATERTYTGDGTVDDPYVVDWDLDDPDDPYNWPRARKWLITAQLATTTFTISFSSSAYTGGMQYTMEDFGISDSVAILGISLYVLGFALG